MSGNFVLVTGATGSLGSHPAAILSSDLAAYSISSPDSVNGEIANMTFSKQPPRDSGADVTSLQMCAFPIDDCPN